jgi:AcrR family transcriptional regulator
VGRPREHDEAVGSALLDAAEALLVEGGVDAVSVRGAALGADTTTRAVYSRFGSKSGLVDGLAERGYQLLAAYVGGLPVTDDPAADLVAAGVQGFRPFAIERPHLFRLTFERLPPDFITHPTVYATLVEAYDALAGWIHRAQEAGVVDDRPVPELAFIYHSTCQGLATNELLRRPPPEGSGMWANTRRADPVELWELALHALVRGLAPVPTRRRGTRR